MRQARPTDPTPFPALNRVLAALVSRQRALLGDNFVGTYLQGSFAIGDFEESSSDVDAVVVLRRDLTRQDVPALQALHAEIHDDLPLPWSRRLELSYAPASILRRWSPVRRDPPGAARRDDWVDPCTGGGPRGYPFLFLDNGARRLVRSEHCDTRIVRWVVRNHGIALHGPDPGTLIDPVAAEDLRAEVERILELSRRWAEGPGAMAPAWAPAFLVTLHCRMLHTWHSGGVASKATASAWAAAQLDPCWAALIESCYRRWRYERAALMQPADPAVAAGALALAAHVRGRIAGRMGQRLV